ncbi:MAG TPA: hypothetical protein VIF57_00475 [Polyangia bacterium]|jgi:hypothetical protein
MSNARPIDRPRALLAWSSGKDSAGEVVTRDGFVFADLLPG